MHAYSQTIYFYDVNITFPPSYAQGMYKTGTCEFPIPVGFVRNMLFDTVGSLVLFCIVRLPWTMDYIICDRLSRIL